MRSLDSLDAFDVKHILCPVDRSELSSLALKYAAVGARVFNAGLTVLEAVHFDYPRYLSDELTESVLRELGTYKEMAGDDLAVHVRSIIGDGTPEGGIDYRVSDLQPAQAISMAIDETGADLVVMGTHGYSGIKHWMLGSVTEGLLHLSKVPVFTVRQKTDGFIDVGEPDSEPEILQILCPCDTRPASARALETAASLARRFGARLTAMRSYETDEAEGDNGFQDWVHQRVQEIPVTVLSRKGEAAELAIEAAAEMKSDLIVLGTRHRAFGNASVLGRTAELILRHAPVPVLSVPLFEENA